ncbi:predicted protein [Nematostella vectensis]|uniref:Potassium channel domain-containing protein n=1 Tax=Nematostella vectensis TaxID=45351 RepID=A7SBV4_NEMVE|nr:uncharacterized protein LOC5510462 [Nematostella vectensis]XP_032235455.1 uncharacterized protein LOC5510462 [Nematostella vectensis]XP_032235456.1 uncharacterized protein LOC5510462 [Nematostella vectensis]XP_032235457.1 uncharacterized protein LOC5510462 [Nematostella vectensis]XP_032235458.1 uncharacterized protein LOC5510462 [Nematostella vectensis]XP_032235459.1 uncharacterized protein LOC5510462 [Nematostella vectensis]XP_032235460.1 uncharacterized protein LOC5510462 [Nematostella v|eukprot:XP_001630895.1 predicted protein [Nematostella vectensis]
MASSIGITALIVWTLVAYSTATEQDFSESAQVADISEGFFLKPDDIFSENTSAIFKEWNASLAGRQLSKEELARFTLDEKCENGLPVSATWQFYGPYARPVLSGKGLGVEGIFPNLINQMLHVCCNNTYVNQGKILESIRGMEETLNDPETAYDLTFPITGTSLDDEAFKDMSFIPFLQAPRVALLVRDKEKIDQTKQLFTTVSLAWPILVFIVVAATFSGIIIWLLDRLKNPDEFPRPFLSGTWEGFWWAFVTMTTVGYGDRAPKSLLARVFCIVWILVGIIIIAIFTAIITASLSASIQHHFSVHGALIGAASGSEEYRLGVSLNAEMKPFGVISAMNDALMDRTLNGSLIDNYVLTHYSKYLSTNPIRIETTYDHPITYGLVVRHNSSRMVNCFRGYLRNHPQEVFEVIAKYLEPLKNPTDDVSQEVKASEQLFFYREKSFRRVLYILLGGVGGLLFLGFCWEIFYHRPAKRHHIKKIEKKKSASYLAFPGTGSADKCDCHEMLLNNQTIQAIKTKSAKIRELIQEYEAFYEEWLTKVREVESNENGLTPHMV